MGSVPRAADWPELGSGSVSDVGVHAQESEVDPGRLGPDAAVGEFLAATIGTGTRQLLRHEDSVRRGVDTEAVHRARVATRRLRSVLTTFGPMLTDDAVARFRPDLAWLGDLLGNVRDPQVLERRLAAQAASLDGPGRVEGAAAAEITDLLVERARFHHTQLVDAMGGDRYGRLVADLVAASGEPPAVSPKVAAKAAAPIAERLARREWKRARRFAQGLGADADDVGFHDVRKRCKRARYAAQSVKRLGLGSREFRRSLAEVQDRLGEHHDLVVQREFLAAGLDRLGRESAFVAGRMFQDADRRRLAMRNDWPALARRLDRLEFG